MINNVEEIVVLLDLKVFYSDNSKMLSCSKNTQVAFKGAVVNRA